MFLLTLSFPWLIVTSHLDDNTKMILLYPNTNTDPLIKIDSLKQKILHSDTSEESLPPQNSIKAQCCLKEALGSTLGLMFTSPPKIIANSLALFWALFSRWYSLSEKIQQSTQGQTFLTFYSFAGSKDKGPDSLIFCRCSYHFSFNSST